jgi:hypothetical protein
MFILSPFSYYIPYEAGSYGITKCQLSWLLRCERWAYDPGVLGYRIPLDPGSYISVWIYRITRGAGCYGGVGWGKGTTSLV